MMTDPISDMLAQIRNAIAVSKVDVLLPHSKLKQQVAKLLSDNGFLAGVEVDKNDKFPMLRITIAQDGRPAQISNISKISKPGRREYVQAKAIPTVRRGRGLVILSTSRGIMTGNEAKKAKVGGEIICEVY